MSKLKIKVLCLAIAFAGSAYIANGQRYVKDVLTHKVVVNHPDKSIVAYVKPVKHISLDVEKRYYWFSPNQINTTQGGFSGKLLNGSYQEFYANKQLSRSGYLNKGLKTGIWKSWDEKGGLTDDYTWTAGRMNGVYHKYDSLGKVLETGKYSNDLLHGKQLTYTNGEPKQVLYKRGKVTVPKKFRLPKFIRHIFHREPKAI